MIINLKRELNFLRVQVTFIARNEWLYHAFVFDFC